MKRLVWFVAVMVVLAFSSASGCSVRRQQKEGTLKLDLLMMRQAIDQYTLDKQQPPQFLQDLVKANYFPEIPTDPFTRKKDWVPQFESIVLRPGESSTGIVDVHSASRQVGSNGIPYDEW